MTAKEFLEQAYYLDIRIRSNLQELAELRKMVYSLSSASLEQSYNPNHSANAPFVKGIESIDALEKQIKTETDGLFKIKEDIRTVIGEVKNQDEQMLLRYKYVHFYSWEKIKEEMHYGHTWVNTLHGRALKSVDTILKNRRTA